MAEQQSNFKVEAVLNNQKQQKLHPAAGVFLNHQLSSIDNESRKLHQSTNHLRANSRLLHKGRDKSLWRRSCCDNIIIG
jgi:hypothetical protein